VRFFHALVDGFIYQKQIGSVIMAKYTVKVTDDCIGCAACCAVCDNFEMDGGKAVPVKKEIDELGCNEDARDTCPVAAIKIEEAGE
jgi:ferredoxin